ncbi:BlaB/IND/MUS family subclass B1 metallo-beta-lactamase [Flavobacterium sp. MAH-1]|uniref:beta-lactamase n=1 Tax=Flavobacterium agri TaxID=2743471 RepID=A0A7Y8Y1L7_9FLAO|nr:BlaB/IND/MUS family subclass B1 metallo-beta-lactamase [Flavobacterium agri]NUY80925.1 BlaB/IND/MUS family subclass B1 metallo-beta-lactamase [Flavobacterium agri]NYA70949.1 BlaB/IND/MUS family subclass B1 metallo-beta-lactamase [Flavobacterium agri]
MGRFLLLLLGLCCFAQNKPLEIYQLTKNTYVYTTYKNLDGNPFPSNGLYVVTDSGVALIDTPWDETQFQPLLDSIEKKHKQKVVLCISTHSHADRTAGLEYFRKKGIKTYSSVATKKLCIKNNEKQAEFTFSRDTIFKVGGRLIQTFYPGEGHTPDNIMIWMPESKVLYGGCFVKSIENSSLGNIADANLTEWPKSIRKAQKRFPDALTVIPGHFKWSGREALQHTIQLLEQH